MLTMLGDMVEEPLDARGLARGLRADCVGAIVGGIFNSFPYTSYAQNIALVSLTGVRSRFVCAGAAVLMLGLALLPKISAVVAAMPPSVLGGAASSCSAWWRLPGSVRWLRQVSTVLARTSLSWPSLWAWAWFPRFPSDFCCGASGARSFHPQRRSSWNCDGCGTQSLPAGKVRVGPTQAEP
jgi:hypothetical protein